MCPLTNPFIYAVEKMTATLSVFNLVVEQLDKDGDDGESSYGGSVVLLPGQDVQSAHCALHLLHPHTVSVEAGGLLSPSIESAGSLGVLGGSVEGWLRSL